MAQTKQSLPKTTVIEVVNPCTCCGKSGKKDFYANYNPTHQQIERFHICKSCMEIEFQKYFNIYQDTKLAVYYVCKKFDVYFGLKAYDGAINQANSTGWSILQSYFKQINSFRNDKGISKNGYGVTFEESSDFLDRYTITEKKNEESELKSEQEEKLETKPKKATFTKEDKENKADVVRLLKFDPFVDEAEDIKGFLYNKLIDFLDEDTLADSFKLPITIEIVKAFGQAERINRALSQIDIVNDSSKIDDVKKLSGTRTDLLRSILSMAKDNGISENYSNNKSKGAGTLSGIIKSLQEKGVHASDINLYDVETCEGMKQVADISNRSILDQLNLNENDYVDMIKDQRNLIKELKEKADKLEEEDRLLKLKIKSMEESLKK